MFKALYINLSLDSKNDIQHVLDWPKLGVSMDSCTQDLKAVLHSIIEKSYALAIVNMDGAHKEGLELCRQIRGQSRIPIIVIESSMDIHMIRKAMRLQVCDYLPSVLQTEELANSVMNIKTKQQYNEDDVIHKVKEYVGKMLHKNITLKEISNKFHFNRSYLGQKFKNHENMSFNEYLLTQRMERAKVLLEQTDLKVYEIANEVGYSEIDWFYKRFKSYTGISANEYRRKAVS